MTQLFGPQVRGGEAAALVQISVAPIDCQPDCFDLLVALDWEKIEQFAPEIPLGSDSIIVADPAAGTVPPVLSKSGARLLPLAMRVRDKGSRIRAANVFAAGAISSLAGIGEGEIRRALRNVLGGTPPDVAEANTAALEEGVAAAASLRIDLAMPAPNRQRQRWLITGNEAVALGALRAGVRFVSCYPITPATDLVEWLSPRLEGLGGRLVLAEDELASINMVLGASYGGVPAMTVTSGPGLSLMVETLGLAVACEMPAVIVDVMRAGPSTGIPSKAEQSDINLAVSGAHGDAPRVVVAPLSVADCAPTAEWAVYVAESLQTPVIVLSDQAMGQACGAIDAEMARPQRGERRTTGVSSSLQFKRYAIGPDPVTAMPRPGTAGFQWVAEGLTHNETGLPASGPAAHAAQLDKRAKKISGLDAGPMWGETWGDGDTAIIAFGSAVGPAREAARRLTATGHRTRVVGLRLLSPLPKPQLASALTGARRVVVLEQNHSAQLYHHMLGYKAVPTTAESLARPGPLPFRPAEIVSHLS
jgi:2-oxoglutarate ferredoxin oxidoreductase subunit alpha